MATTLLATGIACVIAAIVGGGLRAGGIEFQPLHSVFRQCMLAAFGAALIGAAIIMNLAPQPYSPASSDVTWGPLVGGSGGGPFSAPCAKNQALVGLTGKTNPPNEFRVFGAGPVCADVQFQKAPWSSNISVHSLGQPNEMPLNGTETGQTFTLRCPANEVVVGADLSEVPTNTGASYLGNRLQLSCSRSVPGSKSFSADSVNAQGTLISFATEKPFQCPDGQVASAIQGRAGQWVDAMGIGCTNAK